MPKPELPDGEYRFFLTKQGKEQYENTLLNTHKKYLSHIKCEEVDPSQLGEVVYKDEWQVVAKAPEDVFIGKGNLAGKGVYANRDFKEGEVVIQYHLKPLTEEEYEQLPESEKMFTHTHWDQIMLYGEPERYVNHSDDPNTYQDLKKQQDIALKDIKKGEMITGDATKDDIE